MYIWFINSWIKTLKDTMNRYKNTFKCTKFTIKNEMAFRLKQDRNAVIIIELVGLSPQQKTIGSF